jgi:MtN3 and saliva related transmembrane protein
MTTDLIGYFAATLTTLSFIPQALKTIRTRNTSAISSGMYATFCVGTALWFAYGVTLGSWPIILANGITFLLAATILALKIQHG